MMAPRRTSSSPRGASRQASAAPRRSWKLNVRRRELRSIAIGLAGLFLLWGAVQLSARVYPLLDRPLSRVVVTTKLKYLPGDQVESALSSLLGTHFFSLDLDQMRDNLLALPWVAEASVSRRWPDQLVVGVTEQQPLARWGEYGLLNLDGELFVPASLKGFEQLPQLIGPSGSEPVVMEQFHELGYLLRPLGLAITQLHLSNRNTWSLQLGSVQVEVGGGDIETRLKRFVWLYQQQLKGCWNNVERVDLRYDNGVAVRHRDACTA